MNHRAFLYTGGALATVGAAVGAYATLIEPKYVDYVERSSGADISHFVLLSDLHLRKLTDMHARIADEVRRRQVQFIVITGDSVDGPGHLGLFADFLQALPDVPKYVVLGNWEYKGRIDRAAFRRTVEQANGRVLINESVLHDNVALCGLDDLMGGQPDLSRAMKDLSDDAFRVLLAHCPGQRDSGDVRAANFDLMLSGHTHGGQVRPFGVAPVLPAGSGGYVSGWYRGDGPLLYVSRGIGTSLLPVRLGARPEVVFFGSP